eukprot:GILJ01009368.1.p1 GENE.GILJ01009368.1~~GILJ01009368.1.p1  ORF type:complete len:301 (-),score=32.98 GILJ01009368.1:174-1076(-)
MSSFLAALEARLQSLERQSANQDNTLCVLLHAVEYISHQKPPAAARSKGLPVKPSLPLKGDALKKSIPLKSSRPKNSKSSVRREHMPTKLHPQLLIALCHEFLADSTLFACCLTSREWKQLCFPKLFQRSQRLDLELRTLASDPNEMIDKLTRALDGLTRAQFTELKNFQQPPAAVVQVLQALAVAFGEKKLEWAHLKKFVADANLLAKMAEYRIDEMSPAVYKRLGTFIMQPNFQPETVLRASAAAAGACSWLWGIYNYYTLRKHGFPATVTLLAKRDRLDTLRKFVRVAQRIAQEKMM